MTQPAGGPPLPYLDVLARHDRAFVDLVSRIREQALYAPGVLDPKIKLIVGFTMAILRDHQEGARSFAQRARAAGVTDAELIEVVRVITSIAATQNLSLSVPALDLDAHA